MTEDLLEQSVVATESLHTYLNKTVTVRYSDNGRTRTTKLKKLGVTYLYDVFDFLVENREVTAHRRLAKSIEDNGFMLHMQLLVIYNSTTKKLDVIDGQHRLTEARERGLPVSYWVIEDLMKNPIPTVNTSQKKWPNDQYVEHWIALGHKEYETLKEFQELTKISTGVCLALLSGRRVNATGGDGTSLQDKFQDGNFVVAPGALKFSERVGDVVMSTFPFYPQSKQKTFVAAVSEILKAYPKFDLEHWKSRCNTPGFSRHMIPTSSIDQMIRNISNIYDYYVNKKVDLYGCCAAAEHARKQAK